MPGQEWVLLMRVYASRLYPAGLMRHYVSRRAALCHVAWHIIPIGWPPRKRGYS